MKQLKLLITMGVINGMSLEISGKYVLDPSSPAANVYAILSMLSFIGEETDINKGYDYNFNLLIDKLNEKE
jgi:hypothetical protein